MADVTYVELVQSTRYRWNQLAAIQQDELLQLPFVSRIEGYRIFFVTACREKDVLPTLERALQRLVRSKEVKVYYGKEPIADRFAKRMLDPEAFEALSFGSDVAEQDSGLPHYFVTTKAFQLVRDGEKSVIIGPKGSGKSAILTALSSSTAAGYCVVITPEIFATSMLRKLVEDAGGAWDEDEAFISTWIFTILLEVFKRICDRSRGVPEKALRNIRQFLRENATYKEMDLFTRFIGYLKRIQSVKLGDYELTIKTRMLQDLYALEPLYRLIPDLRTGLKENLLILIDELDQGWDNSPHSNRFLGSLLQAAVRIQRLGLRVRVVVFIRSEIFDLVKYEIDQLDKLRSSIEVLRWKEEELGGLVLKRINYYLGSKIDNIEKELGLLKELFSESCRGVAGFKYLVSRTTRRPREVLQFLRHAHFLALSSGQKIITEESILKAEEEFSGWKMEHLCSEYKYIYPDLKDLIWAFRSYGPVSSASDTREILRAYVDSVEEQRKPAWLRATLIDLIQVLYSVDVLGVRRPMKSASSHGILADYEFSYERPSANVKGSESYLIHPAFWSVLEIVPA